jgi:hypothetical protein
MRAWLDELPYWQLQFLAVLLCVVGLCVLQLSFSFMQLYDEERIVLVHSTPPAGIPAGEQKEEPEADPDGESEAE